SSYRLRGEGQNEGRASVLSRDSLASQRICSRALVMGTGARARRRISESFRILPSPSGKAFSFLPFPLPFPSESFPFFPGFVSFQGFAGEWKKKRRNRVCSALTPNRGAGNGARQSGAASPGRGRKQDTRMCWRFIETTLQRVSILSRQSCARAGLDAHFPKGAPGPTSAASRSWAPRLTGHPLAGQRMLALAARTTGS